MVKDIRDVKGVMQELDLTNLTAFGVNEDKQAPSCTVSIVFHHLHTMWFIFTLGHYLEDIFMFLFACLCFSCLSFILSLGGRGTKLLQVFMPLLKQNN